MGKVKDYYTQEMIDEAMEEMYTMECRRHAFVLDKIRKEIIRAIERLEPNENSEYSSTGCILVSVIKYIEMELNKE